MTFTKITTLPYFRPGLRWLVGIDNGHADSFAGSLIDALTDVQADITEEIENAKGEQDEWSHPGLTLFDEYNEYITELENLVRDVERMTDTFGTSPYAAEFAFTAHKNPRRTHPSYPRETTWWTKRADVATP